MTTAEAIESIRATGNNIHNPVTIHQRIDLLIQAGLLSIVLPGEELDFTNKNMAELLQLLKAVGRTDLSLGRIYEGHINALYLIHLFASPQQKEEWFSDAADGCLFGVWNSGRPEAVEILPEAQDGTFGLRGSKTFASGAGIVKRALVTGIMNNDGRKGWQMCIVNMNELTDSAIDYNSWQPLGMQDSLSYTINFCGYEGNMFHLLGKSDDYYRQPHFGGGAIRFCAVQLGGAEALFNETMTYLKNLQRTNDPYQIARLADMTTALTSGDLWLNGAARNWDNWCFDKNQNNRLLAFINLMRAAIENICLRVIELSSKCIGARGLQQHYRMEKIVRDLQFYLRQPAPDASLMDAAKYVIHSGKNIETMWHEDNRTY